MKTLTKMIEYVKEKKSCERYFIELRRGNYEVDWYRNGDIILIKYFGNLVCEINDYNKTKILDNCGYDKYPSTTRIINFLDKYFYNYRLIRWNGIGIYD